MAKKFAPPIAAPHIVTAEQIERASTSPYGSWSRAQFAAWGVPWPPPSGWKEKIMRGEKVEPLPDETRCKQTADMGF
jgi:hypothetical protein